jgi:hypothetical protein
MTALLSPVPDPLSLLRDLRPTLAALSRDASVPDDSFQWTDHILTREGEILHREFLHEGRMIHGADSPRRSLKPKKGKDRSSSTLVTKICAWRRRALSSFPV